MKKIYLLTIAAVVVALISLGGLALAQETPIPVPQGSDMIVWMRGDQVAGDPDLKATVLRNRAVGHYLELLNLALEQVDYAVLFSPFNNSMINGSRRSASNLLPSDGAFIVAGNFDPKGKYNSFKSKGWLEKDYANKKLLWWSTGESYYCSPKGDECVGYLPGGRLVVTRSELVMKEILDVAGNKKAGLAQNETYQRLSDDFFSNPLAVISFYTTVTDQMRNIVKSDTIYIKSQMARSAIEYVDHLERGGIASVRNSDNFNLNGYFGMDSQNNALVVSSLLQIGGGLASLLPPEDPNRELLSNVTISRQDRTVLIQTVATRQQLINILR